MNKWTPSVIIYNLEMIDPNGLIENHYFLFYKRAKKFWDAHKKEFDDRGYEVVLGGVQLWIL